MTGNVGLFSQIISCEEGMKETQSFEAGKQEETNRADSPTFKLTAAKRQVESDRDPFCVSQLFLSQSSLSFRQYALCISLYLSVTLTLPVSV